MKNNIYALVKFLIIFIILVLLFIMGFNLLNKNKTNTTIPENKIEETTPVEKTVPAQTSAPVKPSVKKPVTRDENNMPKSDYKVPEIG